MAEQPVTPQEQEGSLTIADLQTIVNIIDIAMSRGAFRANEAKTVGETYDKVTVFLQNIQQSASAQDAPQDPNVPPGDANTLNEPGTGTQE